MRSHRYELTWKDWVRLVGGPIAAVLLLCGAIRLGLAFGFFPDLRPTFNVDQTVLIHQSESSLASHDADLVFAGDSSCLMDFSARELDEQLGSEVRVLNLGTLSYLSLWTQLEIVRQYARANPGKLKTLVLLLHPEMVRGIEPVEAFTELVETFYRKGDYCPKNGVWSAITCTLGLEAFRNRVLSRVLPVPLRGSYGRFYGFNSELERFMALDQGSARDPNTFRLGSGEGAMEFWFSPRLQRLGPRIRASLPSGIVLVVGLTPVPESLAGETAAGKLGQILEEWKRAIGADAALSNLPLVLPDRLFATRTHLNEEGVALYTGLLARSLERVLGDMGGAGRKRLRRAEGWGVPRIRLQLCFGGDCLHWHPPMKRTNRRAFLKGATATGAGLFLASKLPVRSRAQSPNSRIRVGVMGTNGRGMAHVENFLRQENVEVAYICDVDSRAVDKAMAAVGRRQQEKAKGVTDFRRVLDDPAVDILSIAAPNHWHAPATILACSAGKHVYVEKPGSHNPYEGQLMVAAARKFNRVVQMGNQRRSWDWVIQAINRLHNGEIGKVLFARTWYNNMRPSIGRGKPAPVPEWLDYELWQGPAPERPYKDNLIHYNWHWHWHWGNGELGNNGIHALDLARWGLNVDYPVRVTCGGGRYHYQDDQETPDVYVTTFDFGEKGACWESHSCHPRGFEGTGFGVNFYGEKGSMVIAGNTCRIYDMNQKMVEEIRGRGGDEVHFQNFLDCIRNGRRPNSDIEEGQKSTLLCHLGNIAYRTGSTLTLDPATGRILDNPEAAKLWKREYREGWEPKI